MSLHVRTSQQDNMFFGPTATYASVTRDTPTGAEAVKEYDPPFARLRAYLYVIRHFGRG